MQNGSLTAKPATNDSAAVYVRMSTDGQNHSIQHQLDRIQAYALARGLVITRTFVDEGRSGLTLAKRPGLQSLLAEVTGPACGFSVVVVYDISRWGRFQDIDESAHYEYLCRCAGVSIVYCAEQFVNDGSPMNALMKNIKRIMAAEYSRELSSKVLLAQCRFSRMGYKQGGRPGFGLRQLPVASDGRPREPLLPGERKPMPTDRVALTQGSIEEVALVRRMYAMYNVERRGDSEIARILRSEGLLNHMDNPWDNDTVRRVLTNRRYCGELVFNQTTRRMGKKVGANPEHLWINCDRALEPMVDRPCFDLAQRIRAERAAGPDRAVVLENLRALYRKHGTINIALCRDPSIPGKQTIDNMFGGYVQAYAAAGLPALLTGAGSLGYRTMRVMLESVIFEVKQLAVLCRRFSAGYLGMECAPFERLAEGADIDCVMSPLSRYLASMADCTARGQSGRFRAVRHDGQE